MIGLKAREDRWKRCIEIFEEIGVTKVTRIATVQDMENSHRGYMKDFMMMLRKFQGADLMFFEDDFELTEGWEEVFDQAYRDLPKNWDMLYLGCNLTSPLKKVTNSLYRVQGAWLMHATLLRKEWIDFILKFYRPDKCRIIDEWYRQQAPYREFFMTMPQISYQRPDYSDMEGMYVDYKNMAFNNKLYTRALK